jgi:hypothetical protein
MRRELFLFSMINEAARRHGTLSSSGIAQPWQRSDSDDNRQAL